MVTTGLLVNLVTFIVFGIDKHNAKQKKNSIPYCDASNTIIYWWLDRRINCDVSFSAQREQKRIISQSDYH